MKTICLKKPAGSGVTIIKNAFIDRYMPEANGEFVKIYLYLLRCISLDTELSVSSIADTFDHTEKDVLRALAYWEKQGLLLLDRDKDGEIVNLAFLEPEEDDENEAGNEADQPSCEEPLSEEAAAKETPQPAVEPLPPRKQPLTADRIAELKKQEDIEQLLFIAAQYIGRPLTTSEISNILYYYDTLHFSADLIEYLVEYCVSKGNKSSHYMEKVALGWASEGIQTVAQAKSSTNLYNKKYYSVLNAFGIKNRGPAASEKDYIDRWTDEYHFTMNIIAEACNRTITQTHEASFPYADKILQQWHKKGIRHLEDISRLDTDRMKKKKEAAPKAASSNKFNNFHQRDYDFEQLEKQLLNS
ncbi:MAG: DnaD domain protein [Candidatus Limivivens sp.]|nr:DnaD domain protein [Candidatus Limivivens sp.]